MADPMKIRANLLGDSTEVKVLMSHEMETGQRKDAQGKMIPAWFIQNVDSHVQRQRPCCPRNGGRRSRRIPFLSFKFKGGAKGDKIVDHVDRQPRRHAHRRSDDRLSGGTGRKMSKRALLAAMAASAAAGGRRDRRCNGARRSDHRRRNREVPRSAAGRQSGRAVGSARRGHLERAARPEQGVARAVRPGLGPGRRQGRVRAAAALFRRRRPRDGPRDAPRLVHGQASRASRMPTRRKTPFGDGSASARTSRRWSPTSRRSRGRGDERVAGRSAR